MSLEGVVQVSRCMVLVLADCTLDCRLWTVDCAAKTIYPRQSQVDDCFEAPKALVDVIIMTSIIGIRLRLECRELSKISCGLPLE